MSKTISQLYQDYPSAHAAARELEAAGVKSGDISIVANNVERWDTDDRFKHVDAKHDKDRDGVDDRTEGAGIGAGVGGAAVGAAGLAAGLGAIAIPGIGPIVAAGWLASTLAGVVTGGVAGGVIGALAESGVSKEEAGVYAEALRRGGALVVARVPDADVVRCQGILSRSSIDVTRRGAAYRSGGWSSFDPNETPYTLDQIREDRDLYR
ncbi:MAG TPA: hypothetical protein VHY79_10475 [Rhizomicrobium sp.]|jgi:hypothetical protein|nr:hypothetical protein [Rhizomicrobium sp.]